MQLDFQPKVRMVKKHKNQVPKHDFLVVSPENFYDQSRKFNSLYVDFDYEYTFYARKACDFYSIQFSILYVFLYFQLQYS